jgi:hypothetical protein
MSEVRTTTVTSYQVSIWPEDCSGIDSAMYCCSVVYSGFGKWKVRRGSASSDAPALGSDGQWHYENLPSDRSTEELERDRFDVVTALALARDMAPRVELNGLTATEALARHQHGPWCSEPYSAR